MWYSMKHPVTLLGNGGYIISWASSNSGELKLYSGLQPYPLASHQLKLLVPKLRRSWDLLRPPTSV